MSYLLAANVAIWLGVGGYVLFLAARQIRLEKRIKHLEFLHDKQV
ncbi:MAG: CcmD family protein [Desulfonatronovibrionaceae bacterium]